MPEVNGVPDAPMDADNRFLIESVSNAKVLNRVRLGDLLKALCQKLDADAGVSDTDYESLFTP